MYNIEIAEFLSLALNTVFLFLILVLTQLEQWNNLYIFFPFFIVAIFQIIITFTTLFKSVMFVDGQTVSARGQRAGVAPGRLHPWQLAGKTGMSSTGQ